MQYITVEDIDLIMYYLQQYSKESDFIIVLLKLLNVLMEKSMIIVRRVRIRYLLSYREDEEECKDIRECKTD